MSLTKHLNKIKSWLLPINIILVGILGFGLGRLSRIEENKTPVLIENPTGDNSSQTATATTAAKIFVASKNGAKYYYPTCSGAARIKEENKIWFSTADQARGAGYTPAANCSGL